MEEIKNYKVLVDAKELKRLKKKIKKLKEEIKFLQSKNVKIIKQFPFGNYTVYKGENECVKELTDIVSKKEEEIIDLNRVVEHLRQDIGRFIRRIKDVEDSFVENTSLIKFIKNKYLNK